MRQLVPNLLRIAANHNAPEVVDDEIIADLYFAREFDARRYLYNFKEDPVKERK